VNNSNSILVKAVPKERLDGKVRISFRRPFKNATVSSQRESNTAMYRDLPIHGDTSSTGSASRVNLENMDAGIETNWSHRTKTRNGGIVGSVRSSDTCYCTPGERLPTQFTCYRCTDGGFLD
jgi:hypothetical protein